jgi:DNA-binding NarL/FixJ family response regulator
VRLLEREDELGVLADAIHDAVAGRGSLVLVAGEAGIGKSPLLRELRERTGERVMFVIGACEPLSVPVPLAPLRELVEAAGGGDLVELGSDDRLVLARRVASVLAERRPVVAVIEDIHSADPLTLCDDAAARQALAALHKLGASAAIQAFARERTARGARAMRGPRRSTLAHPAGLTRREREVLDQLATGATNPAIAAALHLSERTVAHHVSAILGKLGATTRLAAIEQARSRGLLSQDGTRADPR